MLIDKLNRPISFKSEEDDCSDNKETERDIQHGKWIKEGTKCPHVIFIGKRAYRLKFRIQKIHWNVSNYLLTHK